MEPLAVFFMFDGLHDREVALRFRRALEAVASEATLVKCTRRRWDPNHEMFNEQTVPPDLDRCIQLLCEPAPADVRSAEFRGAGLWLNLWWPPSSFYPSFLRLGTDAADLYHRNPLSPDHAAIEQLIRIVKLVYHAASPLFVFAEHHVPSAETDRLLEGSFRGSCQDMRQLVRWLNIFSPAALSRLDAQTLAVLRSARVHVREELPDGGLLVVVTKEPYACGPGTPNYLFGKSPA